MPNQGKALPIQKYRQASGPSGHLVFVGMKKLISNCPALGVRPEFRGIMNLKGLDVISTRLWLDQSLPTRFPANVLAGFEPGVGGTYFNLTELQVSLWFQLNYQGTCLFW